MRVQLLAVALNHASSSPTTLNLRRNFREFVHVPEWREGVSRFAEDSPAAYALSEVDENALTVQVNLRRLDPTLEAVEVRAVHPPAPDVFRPFGSTFYDFWRSLLLTKVNVLGEAAPQVVNFRHDGTSGILTLPLIHTRVHRRGVGVHRVVWHWQYRLSSGMPWVDFATTRHQVFIVLAPPTAPWTQAPHDASNTHLPWTEVLDFTCRWASGASTLVDAATLITHAVYRLGMRYIEYGCPILAPTMYAFPAFNCTAFLDRLRGGEGRGRYVNCTDCATILSTFANILGCDLWQSRMQTPGVVFPVNPIRAIGSRVWQAACGLGFFEYHEVAWNGTCTAQDEIFDACIQLDASSPPLPPFTPLLPTNLRFGAPGEGLYRDLLTPPHGREICEPRATTRQRRMIY